MAFLKEPRRPREPVFEAPFVVFALIGSIVLAHVVRISLAPALSEEIIARFGFIPARVSEAFLAGHHGDAGAWLQSVLLPFGTYIFLHANLTHLALNCLWLLAFGPAVARRTGAIGFLGLFLLCGIAAAIFHMAVNWGSADVVIGASGAVAGLMGAAVRLVRFSDPLGQQETPVLLPLWSRQVLSFSAIWMLVNVVAGVTGIGTGPGVQLVAWQAHIGGYAAGLFSAGLFDRATRQAAPAK
jgi:membrane associated rhomboid family serine protease